MSKSKLILPPSGLAIPKSSAPEPPSEETESGVEELIEQAGRGMFLAMKLIEEDSPPIPIAIVLTNAQAFIAEAQQRLLEEIQQTHVHT